MHKKNIPSNHELSVPKPSSSKLANFAAGAFIAINLLASSPTYSQNTKTADDMKNKNTTEKTYIVTAKDNKTLKIDTINLDKIITSPIKWLITHYGIEKTVEIVQLCNLREINNIRDSLGLSPVSLDDHLTKASQDHAEDMYENTYFSHADKKGNMPPVRAKKSGYTSPYVTENIGYNYYSIEDAISEWKKSPVHYKNLTDPKVTHIGIGFSHTYWVNMFGN